MLAVAVAFRLGTGGAALALAMAIMIARMKILTTAPITASTILSVRLLRFFGGIGDRMGGIGVCKGGL